MPFNCIIMGAAGRDFHNFRTFFVEHPEYRVCAFTAAQIPFIAQRSFPHELAPDGYDSDIPIHDESELPGLIKTLAIDFVFFSYSDLAHVEVMHRASIVQAAGASFVLLGPAHTSLASQRKVVAVTATRTGTGKSPLTQWLARSLADEGVRVVTIRHPMPYGNLRAQAVQRFATPADLDLHDCTIEEREEYEPYVRQGLVIFAGVDYSAILQAAEAEADLILWDGGNNDFSFVKADLNIVVCDALRAGHGLDYYPGETNFRAADIVVINKTGQASAADIGSIRSLKDVTNPEAGLVTADLEVTVDAPESHPRQTRPDRRGRPHCYPRRYGLRCRLDRCPQVRGGRGGRSANLRCRQPRRHLPGVPATAGRPAGHGLFATAATGTESQHRGFGR